MFGTVIIDAYTKDETEALAYAIDDICCPSDNYGWASAGIYCFWDYNTHEVLYIGLASDLYERFRQHNGLLPMQNEGCKYKQIQEYFISHTKLGYSILFNHRYHNLLFIEIKITMNNLPQRTTTI